MTPKLRHGLISWIFPRVGATYQRVLQVGSVYFRIITYILLTECEGRTGRISARGLGSGSVQERPRADILPVRSRANSVNKKFITRLLVSEKTRTANATSFSARIFKLIVFVGFLVQFNHNVWGSCVVNFRWWNVAGGLGRECERDWGDVPLSESLERTMAIKQMAKNFREVYLRVEWSRIESSNVDLIRIKSEPSQVTFGVSVESCSGTVESCSSRIESCRANADKIRTEPSYVRGECRVIFPEESSHVRVESSRVREESSGVRVESSEVAPSPTSCPVESVSSRVE